MSETLPETGAESPRYTVTTPESLQAEALASMPEADSETPEPQGATDTANEAESSDPPADEHGEDDGDKPSKPPKGVQKRLDELTREKYEERRRADALQAQLERTIAMLERQSVPQQPAEEATDPNAAPDPDRYAGGEDDRQYLRDLARYEVRQEMAAQQAEQAKRQEIAAIQAREQAAREKYADYQDVVTADKLAPIIQGNPKLIATLATHEQGPDLAYYLATHPEEVRALGAMSHEKSLIHIGKLSIALEQPKDPPKAEQPRVSKAPAPITPIGAGGDPPTVSFDKQLADLVERGDFDRWRQLKSSAKR